MSKNQKDSKATDTKASKVADPKASKVQDAKASDAKPKNDNEDIKNALKEMEVAVKKIKELLK